MECLGLCYSIICKKCCQGLLDNWTSQVFCERIFPQYSSTDEWRRKSQEQAVILDFCHSQAPDAVLSYSIEFFLTSPLSIFPPIKLHFMTKFHWTDSSVHPLLSVYLTTAPPPAFLLSLSLQCFGCRPVAMKRPQQWPLSVRAHRCPRNAYLIVTCFDRGKHNVLSPSWTLSWTHAAVLSGHHASSNSGSSVTASIFWTGDIAWAQTSSVPFRFHNNESFNHKVAVCLKNKLNGLFSRRCLWFKKHNVYSCILYRSYNQLSVKLHSISLAAHWCSSMQTVE